MPSTHEVQPLDDKSFGMNIVLDLALLDLAKGGLGKR